MSSPKADAVLRVHVRPRSHEAGIAYQDGVVTVRVTAAPVDGKATEAVRRVLSKALGLPISRILLRRGATSAHKEFIFIGLSQNELDQRLQ